MNTPLNAPALRVDNLRMAGELVDRTLVRGGPTSGGTTNPLFNFDTTAYWSATNGSVSSDTGVFTEGSASLAISATGYTPVTSRFFSTKELRGVTSKLSIDLYLPTQQPNPYWIGALQMFVSCPTSGVNNTYVGQQDLSSLFLGEFNTLTYTIPSNVRQAFENPAAVCSITLALNVNAGSGTWRFDNLAFR